MASAEQKSPVSKGLIGAIIAVAVIGAIVLIVNKTQSSDPTLTAAPPPAANAQPPTYTPQQQAAMAAKMTKVKELQAGIRVTQPGANGGTTGGDASANVTANATGQ